MRKLLIGVCVLLVAGAALFWILTEPVQVHALAPRAPDLANGKVMFYAGGCASCHATPGQEDKTRLGGGLALKSPFGIFYAPNISPDDETGIGRWSESQFVTAMVEGVGADGAHLYPAFPYPSYRRMRNEDIRDLFAHMKTLPAVSNRVRDHDLPFPFTIRRGIGLWKLAFMREAPITPDAAKSDAWNRGAYLVEGPGHCAQCHSPRNPLGGIIASQRFAGGPEPEGKGWVPNITQRRLKDWSEKDIAYFLEEGMTPEGDAAGGAMTAVVHNMAQLSSADRAAIAAYIKSLPPVEGPQRPASK